MRDNKETYMLYFEVNDVKFSPDKLKYIDNNPLSIEVKFLDYESFTLNQEEPSIYPEELPRFKPRQLFRLNLPTLNQCYLPELQFDVYKTITGTDDREQLFHIETPFSRDQRRDLRNFINKCDDSKYFNLKGSYFFIDDRGARSGCMSVYARLVRCEDILIKDGTAPILPPGKTCLGATPDDDCNCGARSGLSTITSTSTLDSFRKTISCQGSTGRCGDGIFQNRSETSRCDCRSDKFKMSKFEPCVAEKDKLKIIGYKDLYKEKGKECQPAPTDEMLVCYPGSPLKFDVPPNATAPRKQQSKTLSKSDPYKSEPTTGEAKDPQLTLAKKRKSIYKLPSSVATEKSATDKSATEKSVKLTTKFKHSTKRHHHHHHHHHHGLKKVNQLGPEGDRVSLARRRKNYIYSYGDFYPGFGKAHTNCVDQGTKVPAKMGWRWDIEDQIGITKPRTGWRPGALSLAIREIIMEEKAKFFQMHSKKPKSSLFREMRKKKKKEKGPNKSVVTEKTLKANREAYERHMEQQLNQEVDPPPALHVVRRNDKYHISMYPVRADVKAGCMEIPPKPMQFVVDRDMGDASSTASDMEIEYFVPAEADRYRRQRDRVHVNTQVKQAEILEAFKPSADKSAPKEKKGKKDKKGKGKGKKKK